MQYIYLSARIIYVYSFVSRYLRKFSSNRNLNGLSYGRACAGRSGASWPLLSCLELGSTDISAALFADLINRS
jgi:hypothetical protein